MIHAGYQLITLLGWQLWQITEVAITFILVFGCTIQSCLLVVIYNEVQCTLSTLDVCVHRLRSPYHVRLLFVRELTHCVIEVIDAAVIITIIVYITILISYLGDRLLSNI